MTDPQAYLRQLKKNHRTLKEREAKYGRNAPLDLLNQIDDHETALTLTRQVISGEISRAEWVEALRPLLVSLSQAQVYIIYPQPPSPSLPDPETLLAAERVYRERLKARYAAGAADVIPLTGHTSEAVPSNVPSHLLRLALRHRQKIKASYHELRATEQEIKRIELKSLREGVDRYPCLILLGDPGSGKTTALEHLAYELAEPPPLRLRSGQAQPSPATGEGAWLPLPLRLSEFGPGLTVEAFIKDGWGGAEPAGGWAMPELASALESYLEAGKLFLLFDALNEMPHEGYQARAQALRRFINRWQPQGNRFLVTCRALDYGEELVGLQRIEVQPFTDDQIERFLRNVLPDQWPVLWAELTQEKEEQRRLLELARNPYMLSMMVVIFAELGHLSRNRAALMTDFTHMLMVWAEEKCDPAEWLDLAVQREALAVTAFEMQTRKGSGAAVDTRHVKKFIPTQVQPDPAYPPDPIPSPDRVLTLAAQAHIIEMPVDRSSVRFYHQLLQEYFAAREMLKRVSPPLTPPKGRGTLLPLPKGEGWGEKVF